MILPAEPRAARGYKDHTVKIVDITDGSSNVLLFGEKWLRPDQYPAAPGTTITTS